MKKDILTATYHVLAVLLLFGSDSTYAFCRPLFLYHREVGLFLLFLSALILTHQTFKSQDL